MRIRRLAVVTGAVAAIAGGVWAKVSRTSPSPGASPDGSTPESTESSESSESQASSEKATS